MAYSVLDSAQNAYAVFMRGGPHVIWGRGLACPDNIVLALLVDGTPPVAREQHCEQELVVDYTPLTLTTAAERADPVTVARAVDTELYQIIPLNVWDTVDPLTIGCEHGGTLTATPTYAGTDYSFADCGMWPDLAITGSAVEANSGEADDAITIDISVTGSQSGMIRFQHRLADEAWTLSGTWNGQPATLSRLP